MNMKNLNANFCYQLLGELMKKKPETIKKYFNRHKKNPLDLKQVSEFITTQMGKSLNS